MCLSKQAPLVPLRTHARVLLLISTLAAVEDTIKTNLLRYGFRPRNGLGGIGRL